MPGFPRRPVFRIIFSIPFWTPFFPKVTPQGSPKGPQNPPKWSPKACVGESQSAPRILTTFFHIFHQFSNMAMCCKCSKYHIETTCFTCTRGQRKSRKNIPKTPQIHSKNHSKISPKPNSNRDPEKNAPKSASKCDKVPKMVQNGVPKK